MEHPRAAANGSVAESAAIPRPKPQTDVRKLTLSPEDAFVLSRVDGRASPHEIELTTGLPPERVLSALRTLAELGAIIFEGIDVEPLVVSSNSSGSQPAVSAGRSPSATSASSPAFGVRLERMARDLETKSYYELLGVPRTADKKAIRAAYFRLVADYHPDKYYGQPLGDAKAALERIFQVLTQAHETLTRSNKRSAYDASHPPAPETLGTDPQHDSERPDTLRSSAVSVSQGRAARER